MVVFGIIVVMVLFFLMVGLRMILKLVMMVTQLVAMAVLIDVS